MSFCSMNRPMIFWPKRGNQLPVSAARWQHGTQIRFATFTDRKIAKLLKTRQPLKLEKK
jgi:hypothetical protein